MWREISFDSLVQYILTILSNVPDWKRKRTEKKKQEAKPQNISQKLRA